MSNPTNAATKTFNREAMMADFLRRWNCFNDAPPPPSIAEQYVSEWVANLTREGWVECHD